MAGPAIQVTIDDSPFRAALLRLQDFGDSGMLPALTAIGAAMVTSTKLRFTRGVGPDGAPWKPSQRAKREGGKTLILSGRLWQSVAYNATASFVEWGTNVLYASIHQFGGTIRRQPHAHTIYRHVGKDGIEPGFVKKKRSNFAQDVAIKAYNVLMPARPYLGIDQADKAEALDILTRHTAAAAAGRSP
jgi:phage gpG-like protein